MNRHKSFRAALSGFTVAMFFHLVYRFGFSERTNEFNTTSFIIELALVIGLGTVVFVVGKDQK